jgi:hypothetical protein
MLALDPDAEATDARILRTPVRLMRLDVFKEAVDSEIKSSAFTLADRAFLSIVSTSSWNRSQVSCNWQGHAPHHEQRLVSIN